jgi:hypothetical protein
MAERVTATALGRRKEIQLRVAMPVRDVLARLSSRVARAWPGAGAVGDLARSGYVGDFDDARFRIRATSPVPRYYALQAFGSLRAENGTTVVTVRFRRRRWASIMLWVLRVLWIALVAGAIVASTQQAAFYPFVLIVLVGGGAFLWTARERRSDRESLHQFIIDAFPGAEEAP